MNHDRKMGFLWGLLAGVAIGLGAGSGEWWLAIPAIIPMSGCYLFRDVH